MRGERLDGRGVTLIQSLVCPNDKQQAGRTEQFPCKGPEPGGVLYDDVARNLVKTASRKITQGGKVSGRGPCAKHAELISSDGSVRQKPYIAGNLPNSRGEEERVLNRRRKGSEGLLKLSLGEGKKGGGSKTLSKHGFPTNTSGRHFSYWGSG